MPFDPCVLQSADDAESKTLLRAMAIAGFAAGNIMLFSVSVWAGHVEGMASGTRDLFHWISALIAIPVIAYAGQPFFRSAWEAIRNRRTNMDVPISLAIILAPSISLVETFGGGAHAYFDSAVTLLFFLLIGRYLDRRVRARARLAVEQLTALNGTAATVIDDDGRTRDLPPTSVRPGMRVLVAAGGRIPVDGVIESGASDLDLSILTGESAPAARKAGDEVFAGAVNLTGAAARGDAPIRQPHPARRHHRPDGSGGGAARPLRAHRRSGGALLLAGRPFGGAADVPRLDLLGGLTGSLPC